MAAVLPLDAGDIHPRGITLDGTLGTAGKTDLQGPNYEIKAEYGRQAGPNLFHSFGRFNLHSDERAAFSGPGAVQNIIGRITGGEATWIDGPLSSTIPGADLYLLNRAGMIFGPNAALHVSGSFHVSTGDYLRMGENERFYAMPQAGEVLSFAAPTALGFLDDGAAEISVQGRGEISEQDWLEKPASLRVSEGRSISLIGGDIKMTNGTFFDVSVGLADPDDHFTPFGPDGNPAYMDEEGRPVFFDPEGRPVPYDAVRADELTLVTETIYPGDVSAPGGRINMAAAAAAGEVVPKANGLDTSSVEATGKISLSGKFLVSANEEMAPPGTSQGAGAIFIQGGTFVMDDSAIQTETFDSQESGRIDIQADTASLRASHLSASTRGIGKGGDIVVTASESIRLHGNDDYGEGSAMAAYTHTGDGGEIRIETKALTLDDGAELVTSSNGPGRGGDIILQGPEFQDAESVTLLGHTPDGNPTIISVSTRGSDADAGDAGTVLIETENLSLNDGAQIASISQGGGRGGDVTIHASESVRFSGNQPGGWGSSIVTRTLSTISQEIGAAKAGDVMITTKALSLDDGAWIGSYTEGSGEGGR